MAKKKPYRFFVYLIARAADFLLSLLPRRAALAMARAAGSLGYHLVSRQREKALKSLRLALGSEKSEEAIQKIAQGVFQNFAQTAVEILRLPRLSKERLASLVDLGDAVQVYESLLAEGKGLIAITAHIGNWELPAIVARAAGLQTMVLYRPPSVRSVAYAVHNVRTRSMGEMMPAGLHATFALARALQEGKHVAMLADQHDGRGVAVNFFGRPCRANPLIAMLAREYDVPIHGVYAKRLPAGRGLRRRRW